jgi:hypothetical protein
MDDGNRARLDEITKGRESREEVAMFR